MNLTADESRLPNIRRPNPCRLIVCEQTGRWTVALRRELAILSILPKWLPLDETRSVVTCWERLKESPASFLVVEPTRNNCRQLMDRMGDMKWRFPLARIAVVASPAANDKAWFLRSERLFRDSGAIFFAATLRADSPQGVTELAGVVFRHFQQSPAAELSLSEAIWQRLPWPDAST